MLIGHSNTSLSFFANINFLQTYIYTFYETFYQKQNRFSLTKHKKTEYKLMWAG